MSECTCGSNWRDDYCARHGLFKPSDRRIHELQNESEKLKEIIARGEHLKPASPLILDNSEVENLKAQLDEAKKTIQLVIDDAYKLPHEAAGYIIGQETFEVARAFLEKWGKGC